MRIFVDNKKGYIKMEKFIVIKNGLLQQILDVDQQKVILTLNEKCSGEKTANLLNLATNILRSKGAGEAVRILEDFKKKHNLKD